MRGAQFMKFRRGFNLFTANDDIGFCPRGNAFQGKKSGKERCNVVCGVCYVFGNKNIFVSAKEKERESRFDKVLHTTAYFVVFGCCF